VEEQTAVGAAVEGVVEVVLLAAVVVEVVVG